MSTEDTLARAEREAAEAQARLDAARRRAEEEAARADKEDKPSPVPPPEMLTVAQVCEELQISRATWDRMRRSGQGPRARKLPTGALRIRRADLNAWAAQLEEVA